MMRVIAAMCFGMSLLVCGYASAEQTGSLPRGGVYVLRRDASVPTAAIELWFRAPAVGFNGAPILGLSRLAATTVAASKPLVGDALSARVARYGGRMVVSVYHDAVSVGISIPAAQAREIVSALTTAYFSPVLTSEGMTRALRDVARATLEKNFKPDETLHDALFERVFVSGPGHYATLPANAGDLQKITMPQLQSFAQRAFRVQNAVLTIAGNIDSSVLTSVNSGRGSVGISLRGFERPYDSLLSERLGQSARPFSEDGVGFAWVGPPISDEPAATALDFIADYLFRSETGVAQVAVSTALPDMYVSGQFVTLHNPGVMLVSIAGKRQAAARKMVEDSITSMMQPLSPQSFLAAKAAFRYHILSDLETPLSQADNFGWYTVEGNPTYAPGASQNRYFAAAQALSPQAVAEVARKYLTKPAIVTLIGTESK
ncbi:MAG: hypothetical protein M3Z14_07740 [Candidatus Eremiobacteraeota bacterium]|nr:hypothetical protein [Candidatus Eremiobacteraeota bacterium]